MEKLRPGEEALRSRAWIGGAELKAGSAYSLHSDRDHVSCPQLGRFAKSMKVGFPSNEFGDVKLYYEGVYLLSVWRPLPFASSLTAVLASAREPVKVNHGVPPGSTPPFWVVWPTFGEKPASPRADPRTAVPA